MLSIKIERKLRAVLPDGLITERDIEFDEARKIWNAMIDRKPAAICRCHSTIEVQQVLLTALASGLAVTIKGGGHNIAGTAIADDALMLDLSPMKTIEVDVQNRLALVDGGVTWAEFDAAAQAHGLATPGGVVSSTGVAGLTLGGGFGWLARKYGLAVDNLLFAEVVLANGHIVTASQSEHPDLFWALRGGGGNFGVVTRFGFRLHKIGPDVLFGPTFFALEDAERVLSAYSLVAPQLPREMCVWANLMTAPTTPALPPAMHGTKVLTLMQFVGGNKYSSAATHLEQLYGGATPIGSGLAVRPYLQAQRFLDETYEHGARNYWRAHNHTAISTDLITTLVELASELPTPGSELLINHLGGAVSDVPTTETAFPHRQIPFMCTPGLRWTDPSKDDALIDWLHRSSERISAHSVPGKYVNFITETDNEAAHAYVGNLEKLVTVKRQYDPENVFASNQNIIPA